MDNCPTEYMNNQLSGYTDIENSYDYMEKEDNNVSKKDYSENIEDKMIYKK